MNNNETLLQSETISGWDFVTVHRLGSCVGSNGIYKNVKAVFW